jgi:hypothetical protein
MRSIRVRLKKSTVTVTPGVPQDEAEARASHSRLTLNILEGQIRQLGQLGPSVMSSKQSLRGAALGRASGLMRLWIVISGAWLIGTSIYVWYDAANTKIQMAKLSTDMCAVGMQLDLVDSLMSVTKDYPKATSAQNPNSAPRKSFTDCINEAEQQAGISPLFSVNWPLFLFFSFVPIPLLWLVVFGPIRWVAHGFR